MVRVVREVCDVCRNDRRKVQDYRIARDSNRLMRIVLCAEHAESLEELLKIAAPVASNAPDARLWTIEEIEKEKRRLKKNGNS
jgi:hypothetical protein